MKNTYKKFLFTFLIGTLTVSTAYSQAATTAITLSVVPKSTPSSSVPKGGMASGTISSPFAKYTACLAKAGIKTPAFGIGRGYNPSGVRPTGAPATNVSPRPRPTFSMTPTQQKAFTACASLRPSFAGFGKGGTIANGIPKTGVASGNTAKITPKPSTAPLSGSKPKTVSTPKAGTSIAYIACLNAHGIPVTTASQLAGLDNQNTKILATEKTCAGK